MPQLDIDIIKEVFHVSNFNFDPLAIQVFQYQYAHNSLYREYCDLLKRGPVMCIQSWISPICRLFSLKHIPLFQAPTRYNSFLKAVALRA